MCLRRATNVGISADLNCQHGAKLKSKTFRNTHSECVQLASRSIYNKGVVQNKILVSSSINVIEKKSNECCPGENVLRSLRKESALVFLCDY